MTTTDPIDPTDSYLDSRDIIARIADLEDQHDGVDADDDLDADETAELKALLELEEEAAGYSSDWRYGAILIADDSFEDYARELARDIGAISGDEDWPLRHIDWSAACDELKMDYVSVEYDGYTFWLRAC